MIAWHYTTGENFLLIIEDGVLRPAHTFVEPPERPILWFSFNQRWELTANKFYADANGRVKKLDMRATMKLGGGLARFGVPADFPGLYRWPRLAEEARMPENIARGLQSVGKKDGANPREWAGMLEALPVSACTAIEVMDADTMRWTRVRGSSD